MSSDDSEIEELGDSGEDWTPEKETSYSRKRTSVGYNNGRNKRRKAATSSDSEEEQLLEPRPALTQDIVEEEDPLNDDDEDDYLVEVPIEGGHNVTIPQVVKPVLAPQRTADISMKEIPREFHSGNFIVLKKDVERDGDVITTNMEKLMIWKIDGKALLQKYAPFQLDGRWLHKSTCVYSGWNPDAREKYYSISSLLDRNPRVNTKETCVALDVNDLIRVKDYD